MLRFVSRVRALILVASAALGCWLPVRRAAKVDLLHAALRAGRLAELIAVALVAHHMIRFARECGEGRQNASFYSDRPKAAVDKPVAAV